MFDKFGFMGTAEELNNAAAGQKEQGDIEALKILAEENGIDSESVQEYIENERPFLCSEMEMGIGRMKLWDAEISGVTNSQHRTNYRVAKNVIEPMMSETDFRKKVLASKATIVSLVKKIVNSNIVCGTDEDLRQLAHEYFSTGSIGETAKKIRERYE